MVATEAEEAGRSPLLQREPFALLFCSALEGLDDRHSPAEAALHGLSVQTLIFSRNQLPTTPRSHVFTGYLCAPEPSGLKHKTNRHRLLALPPTGWGDFLSISLLAGKQGPDNTALQARSLCNVRDGDFVGDSH